MNYGDPNSCPDCEKRGGGTLICSRCMTMLSITSTKVEQADIKTEMFKGLCGSSGRFAKKSVNDMRTAGREAAKALNKK